MMTFVNMDSDGLVILPTHRVVHSLKGFEPAGFLRAAEQFFTVQKLPTADANGYIKTLGAQKGPAFVAVTRDGDFLLRRVVGSGGVLAAGGHAHEVILTVVGERGANTSRPP